MSLRSRYREIQSSVHRRDSSFDGRWKENGHTLSPRGQTSGLEIINKAAVLNRRFGFTIASEANAADDLNNLFVN